LRQLLELQALAEGVVALEHPHQQLFLLEVVQQEANIIVTPLTQLTMALAVVVAALVLELVQRFMVMVVMLAVMVLAVAQLLALQV